MNFFRCVFLCVGIANVALRAALVSFLQKFPVHLPLACYCVIQKNWRKNRASYLMTFNTFAPADTLAINYQVSFRLWRRMFGFACYSLRVREECTFFSAADNCHLTWWVKPCNVVCFSMRTDFGTFWNFAAIGFDVWQPSRVPNVLILIFCVPSKAFCSLSKIRQSIYHSLVFCRACNILFLAYGLLSFYLCSVVLLILFLSCYFWDHTLLFDHCCAHGTLYGIC